MSQPTASSTPTEEEMHSTPSVLASLFSDRRAHHEAKLQEAALLAKAELEAKALAREQAIANDPARAAQRKYAQERQAQMQADRLAKERVLARIAADKVERQEKVQAKAKNGKVVEGGPAFCIGDLAIEREKRVEARMWAEEERLTKEMKEQKTPARQAQKSKKKNRRARKFEE